jgi:hypothetical protein
MFSPILAIEQHAALVIHERHAEAAHQRLLSKLRLGRARPAAPTNDETIKSKAQLDTRQTWAEA